MLNPIALTRLAGLALALSLTASCGVETNSELALPIEDANGASAGENNGAPETPDADAPETGVTDVAGSSNAGSSNAEAPKAGGPEPEAPDAEAPPPVAPATDVSTWVTGDTIPSGREGVKDIEILELRNNGSGPVCGNGKRATLKYKAMLADGTVRDPGTRPFSFTVGEREAIAGWDVIVKEMRVGDSFIVTIPEALAYPRQGDWKFEMELLSFK